MFTVDESTAEAIRRACAESGELGGVAELRRHCPLISGDTQARECVRAITGWKPLPATVSRLSGRKKQGVDVL